MSWDKSYDGHDYDPRLLSECPQRKKPLTFEDFPEYEGKLIDKLTKIQDKYCK